MRTSTKQELSALSRMFSPAVMRELGKSGTSPLLARLLRETRLPDALPWDATLADAFELAFATLCRMGNRDDYVYRTAITQKVVLGRHSLRTATVLNEVRAGRSKADVVVLNGTATAYEIKSERDSFRRLPQQLADYCSVFASVNVVTSPNQVEAVLQIAPKDVGVLTLSSRYRLQTVRKAVDRPERTSPVALLETLRVDEAAQVLSLLRISCPDVPNTLRWGMLREIFGGLEAASVHSSVVRVLKSTRSCAGLEPVVKLLPVHLAAAVLSTDPSPAATRNLSTATWQPLTSVLAWS